MVPVAFAQGAVIEVTPSGRAAAGSTVTVKWSGPNGPGDYITVARKGAGPFEYLGYRQTSDGRTAVNPVSIVLPPEPGAYEIRYLLGNPRTVLAVVPYEVTAVAATIEGPASIAPGARFEIVWSGPNNGGDWVTIVAAGAPPRAYGSYVEVRAGTADDKTGRRSATLRAPAEPGRYELRYVQQGRLVIGTRPIDVGAEVARTPEGSAPATPAPQPPQPAQVVGPPPQAAPQAPSTPQGPVAFGNNRVVNTSKPSTDGGGLTTSPNTTIAPPTNPVDPANFTAEQRGDGVVHLRWNTVAGAGSYMVGGPATGTGRTASTNFLALTGVPPGTHTWTVATVYAPGGIMTTADKWSKVTFTVKAMSGRYRIVLNGFKVNQETYDDQLNFDGQHDEVYASVAVAVTEEYGARKVLMPTQIVKSAVHGDLGKGGIQVRAGSILPTGGIATGDIVPNMTNPALPAGPASANTFPLVLWEGPLADDKEMVAIMPVLWEWDGNSELYDEWARTASRLQTRAAGPSMRLFTFGNAGEPRVKCSALAANVNTCRPGVDRPIGLGNCYSLDVDTWCDISITFTRKSIEQALSSPYQAGGIPPGVIHVQLKESRWDTRANYDVYFRVERVP